MIQRPFRNYEPRKPLREYKNEELISYLNNNETVDLSMMAGLLSELLRRMNERSPLLPEDNQDWGTPITPYTERFSC